MYNDYIYCCCCLVSKSCPFFCDLMDNQATLSMEFSRQEYRSGLPFPPTGHLPNPGIKPVSLVSPALAGRFFITTAAATKLLQSCLTLYNPRDGSPPGSPVPGILQARTLEWVAISFSNAWKWKVKIKSLSCVRLVATSWTGAYQAPPSMGFSKQECLSGVPLPSPLYHWAMWESLLIYFRTPLCFGLTQVLNKDHLEKDNWKWPSPLPPPTEWFGFWYLLSSSWPHSFRGSDLAPFYFTFWLWTQVGKC